jgi:murein L,D-transpeptidase YafK
MMLDARAKSGSPIHASGALLCSLLFAGEAVAEKADFVRVDKSERRMELLAKDVVLRTYHIALGASPLGHKQQQGDERTPEGRYILDWRNPKSAFTTSIHISYPNDADQARAREAGVPPGGDIMIHGQPKGFGWWAWLFQMFDWTNGCIAVTDEEMKEVWDMVADGTPIEINP